MNQLTSQPIWRDTIVVKHFFFRIIYNSSALSNLITWDLNRNLVSGLKYVQKRNTMESHPSHPAYELTFSYRLLVPMLFYMVPNFSSYNLFLQRPQVPVQTFTLMPQSHTLVRLVYQGMYCLELRLKGNGVVTIRDGAYSRFDRSNVVDDLTPTQGIYKQSALLHISLE